MSTEIPAAGRPSAWHRFTAAVRYVLDLEPVVVQGLVRAVLVLVAAVGVTVPEWIEPRIAGVIVAAYAVVELITSAAARRRAVPVVTVVEQLVDDRVVAGPASELPTGTDVRAAGSLEGGLFRE